MATGHPSGHVYFWRHRRAVRVLQPSLCPPRANLPSDGNPWRIVGSSRGVRCIRCWKWKPPQRADSVDSTADGANGTARADPACWSMGIASHEGAVHIWELPEDSFMHSESAGAKSGSGLQLRRTGQSRRQLRADSRSWRRGKATGENGAARAARARRVASVWVPRLPRAVSRSPVRAFDVAAEGGGLLVAVGTYDGTLWACRVDPFPPTDAEARPYEPCVVRVVAVQRWSAVFAAVARANCPTLLLCSLPTAAPPRVAWTPRYAVYRFPAW